jgi:protein-disulfide isomerase
LQVTLIATLLGLACGQSDSGAKATSRAPDGTVPAAAAATPPRGTDSAAGLLSPAAQRGSPDDSLLQRADRGRIRGDEHATLWVIEASDFQCPYCKIWHDSSFARLVHDYVDPGRVRVAYINYPLPQHQNAMPAAEAAMCASAQDKFWPMHDSLFAAQHRWETLPNAMPAFDSMAARMGADMTAWRRCMAEHLARRLIDADYERARNAGVKSTPSFFVGDQRIDGAQPYSVFRGVIEAQLAKAGGRR